MDESGLIPPPDAATPLPGYYASEFRKLQARFETDGDGLTAIRARTVLLDRIISCLYTTHISPALDGPKDFCLIAVGGYGRKELFPFSDIDLLFVAANQRALTAHREGVATLARSLWDLRMRVGHSARTLSDCGQLHPDNLEFSISLLDLRYLAGDSSLFEKLCSDVVPHLAARDQQDLVRNLLEVTSQRHAKHGNTIFHLEPNIKEAPGGLRDYHTTRWLSRIAQLAEHGHSMPEARPSADEDATVRFLSALRCFLHFERGRDDNLLTYELQERAAALGLGVSYGSPLEPAPWMRKYYLHVRSIHRRATASIESVHPSRSSLYSLFQDWRSRLSNADFSVIRGKIYPRSSAPSDWALLLSLFEMVARHALELSGEAERWAEESLRSLTSGKGEAQSEVSATPEGIWPALRKILLLPHAADALRAMHRLGVLTALFPEFRAIDALVIRDFYHRYTVDEHSFTTIQNLCGLTREKRSVEGQGTPLDMWEEKLAELASEVEQPELLRFALLFHDVGKGMDMPGHVEGSLRATEGICARLGLSPEDRENVLFLIAQHLEMSSTISRRDIFDSETIRSFAQKVRTSERLKMLCLFTYADIKAVNPEALTPWKAELLWQLYVMTFNYLSRSLDQDRLPDVLEETAVIRPVLARVKTAPDAGELRAFLEGFPRRYLNTHPPQEIAEHFQWSRALHENEAMVRVISREHACELTVLAQDKPFLFTSITGCLAGWGMNILKADAFANRAGIVLDVFRFHDLFRTLELNPLEISRLEKNVASIIIGKLRLAEVMAGRKEQKESAKVETPTSVSFDDASSSRCTLLELVTQDRPGLLYSVSSVLASLGCNIEVALADTEARKAVDVFYLTLHGDKLSHERQEAVRAALFERLSCPSLLTP